MAASFPHLASHLHQLRPRPSTEPRRRAFLLFFVGPTAVGRGRSRPALLRPHRRPGGGSDPDLEPDCGPQQVHGSPREPGQLVRQRQTDRRLCRANAGFFEVQRYGFFRYCLFICV